MSLYYYLLSSLPLLSFNKKPPFSKEGFLALCAGVVSDADYKCLCSLTLEGGDFSPFAKEWKTYYLGFQETLAYERNRRHLVSAQRSTYTDPASRACVTKAVALSYGEGQEKNPLQAELLMLKHLFYHADAMVGLSQYDKRALYGYEIKLLILSRKERFSVLDGKAEYQKLFSNLQSIIFRTDRKVE